MKSFHTSSKIIFENKIKQTVFLTNIDHFGTIFLNLTSVFCRLNFCLYLCDYTPV